MARHIMAVCVVCLLCADRMPCAQHFDDGSVYTANIEYQALNAKVFQRLDSIPIRNSERNLQDIEQTYTTKATATTKTTIITTKTTGNTNNNHRYQTNNIVNGRQHAQHRRKRHAGHSHGEATIFNHRPEITQDFLQRIFDEYGHGDGTLSITEFRSMLTQLGLHQLVAHKLSSKSSYRNGTGNCVADTNLVQRIKTQIEHNHEHNHEHEHTHAHGEGHNFDDSSHNIVNPIIKNANDSGPNCSTTSTTLDMNSSTMPCAATVNRTHQHTNDTAQPLNYSLNVEDVYNLCPVLLYQLASPSSEKRNGCIDDAILDEIDLRSQHKFQSAKEDIVYVWIYAFISVFACGILGLVGVAIIPFMDSRYYKHIIQYLVSLAVGTMTGDALLHLLPHSLAGQTESNMIYKGLTCMGGIIFFYITEHGLTMISEWRKRKVKKDTKPSRAKVVRDPDSSITNSVAGDKLCKSKYSSYPFCYDEIAMDTKNDVWLHLPNNATAENRDPTIVAGDRKRNGRAEANPNEAMAAQSLLSTSHNNYAPMNELNNHRHQHHDHQQQPQQQHQQQQQQQQSQQTHQQHNHHHFEGEIDHNSLGDGNMITNATSNGGGGNGSSGNNTKEKHSNDTVTVILREHESSHHGHSHKHGHVHSPPESLSAVAWMIIMGDGLHNFTDGMAIGAAFAENIAGGFSTSLAVFCHELPHELGDFAILMKAGMSVKSAVYYNLLTGVLSFIGMIFGIVFGQSQAAAQWMFAAAAGLFIYIALVDMMPELSAAHKSLEQLALQVFGMSTGIFLMLLIAIYEGDLMNIFSSSSATLSSTSSTSLLASSLPATSTAAATMTSFEPASGH